MQIGLWYAENRWDEMGSTAYLEAASSAGKVEESGKGKAPGRQSIDFRLPYMFKYCFKMIPEMNV